MTGAVSTGEPPKAWGERIPRLVRRPLISAAVATCLGALMPPRSPVFCVAATLAAFVITMAMARRRRIPGAFFHPVGFFFLGMAATALALPPVETLSQALGGLPDQPVFIEGILSGGPEERPDHTRLMIDLVATATVPGGVFQAATGRVRLSLAGRAQGDYGAGDRVRAWVTVKPIDDPTFPGGSSRRARAARRGVTLLAYADREDRIARLERGGGLGTWMERLRTAVHRGIDRALPSNQAAIVRAFATGDRSGIEPQVDRAFAASGLAHLLAVSGLNLAIVAGLFSIGLGFVLRRSQRISLGFGARRAGALIAIPFVVLYTLLVGASPSAVRAAVMVIALLLAQLTGRLREAWSALAFAVIGMVVFDPTTLGDVSFQLSFAAVAALLRLQPALMTLVPVALKRPALVRWPIEVMVATLAASLGTAPLIARHFGQLPISSLLANVPAGPLSSLVLVPLSLLGGLLATISDGAARPILWLAGIAGGWLTALAESAAHWPLASLRVPQPTILECVLAYGVTIGLGAALSVPRDEALSFGAHPAKVRPKARRRAIAMMLVSLLAIFVSYGASQLARIRDTGVTITFLPVGQGDAAVIELPGGKTMLVDTGPPGDAAERVVLAFLRHRRIPRLDWVVLTHPHADHVGGLGPIAAALPIGELWWTGDRREVPPGLLDPLNGLSLITVTASTAPLEVGPARIRVLGPRRPPEAYATVNDASVVLLIERGDERALLTGDAEVEAEAEQVEAKSPLKAGALKLGHHGSRTSSTEVFLDAVEPKIGVISLGPKNHFGFPSPVVLDRLEARGVSIGRTDRGAVILRIDDRGITMSGSGACSP